jgi:hypothetical protein
VPLELETIRTRLRRAVEGQLEMAVYDFGVLLLDPDSPNPQRWVVAVSSRNTGFVRRSVANLDRVASRQC